MDQDSRCGLATRFPPMKYEPSCEGNCIVLCSRMLFQELTNFFINVGKTLSVRAGEHGKIDAMQLLLEHGAGLGMYRVQNDPALMWFGL